MKVKTLRKNAYQFPEFNARRIEFLKTKLSPKDKALQEKYDRLKNKQK